MNTDVTGTVTVTTTPYVTETDTTTITTTVAPDPIEKRSAAAKIPAYVSTICNGNVAARFASACSCLGVTSTRITLPTPTHTSTVYVSVKSTKTIVMSHTTTATRTLDAKTTTTFLTLVATETCALRAPCTLDIEAPFYDLNKPCSGVYGTPSCICRIAEGAGNNGSCTGPCIAPGDLCGQDSDCCSGSCPFSQSYEGKPYGFCASPVS